MKKATLNKHQGGAARHIPIEEVTKDAVPISECNFPDATAETGPMRPGDQGPEAGRTSDIDDDALLEAVNAHDIDDEPSAQGNPMPEAPSEVTEELPQTTEPVDPRRISQWVALAPDYRLPETSFVTKAFGTNLMVDENKNLMAPVMVGDWTMLLVYDCRFPRPAEQGPTARIYFVSPTPDMIAATTGIPIDTFSRVGDGNERYLIVDNFDKFCRAYVAGRSKLLMAEKLLNAASELRVAYEEAKAAGQAKQGRWVRPTITQSKYTDTRTTTPDTQQHPACRKVVLSNRAFVQIYNETQAHINTETGGLLLGHYENGVWYVVEASDPGWDAVFRPSYHEANENYENHVCSILSRTYRHPLAFLGMWHRHPGSLDTFSGTDDDTNSKYVDSCGNGCISALINYDPDYRITFYYVERTQGNGVAYYQVDVEVGDDRFDNPEILQVAGVPGGARGVLVQPDPLTSDTQRPTGPQPPANPNGRQGHPRKRAKEKAARKGRTGKSSRSDSAEGFFMLFPRL